MNAEYSLNHFYNYVIDLEASGIDYDIYLDKRDNLCLSFFDFMKIKRTSKINKNIIFKNKDFFKNSTKFYDIIKNKYPEYFI